MAEKKNIATGYIGNALRSSAANHTTTFADEIFDTERQQYQSDINGDLEQSIDTEIARAKAAEEAIIYDVSSHNGGAVFESISALLSNSNLDTLIPTSVRHGGMTIRFIQGSEQSSDNKYVQYRLMSDTFSTTENDWQGVDKDIVVDSRNLIESGAVYSELYNEKSQDVSYSNYLAGYIKTNGDIESDDNWKVYYIPCLKGDRYKITFSLWNSVTAIPYAVYNTDDSSLISASTVETIGERILNMEENVELIIDVVDDAKTLCITSRRGICTLSSIKKITYESKFDVIEDGALESMVASRDYSINGNVIYDSNEIPQSYNIKWADGTSGTVTLSNFNYDVFEYTTITATYKTQTIVYTLTYDANGYITNEIFNIQ